MTFSAHEYFDGIYHIQDPMGVCFTLILGSQKALLVDAGYGLADPLEYLLTLTDKPIDLWLTHGHHDHALGAMWFSSPHLHMCDQNVYSTYTGIEQRKRVLEGALKSGIESIDKDRFLTCPMPAPVFTQAGEIDLGGVSARIISVPGHTPGSVMVYIAKYRLLLTGDNWNPCTWLFFPEALPIRQYRSNMVSLLNDVPFMYVLCPHQTELYSRKTIDCFIEGLTDEAIQNALPCDTGNEKGIETSEIHLPQNQVLVFDVQKS